MSVPAAVSLIQQYIAEQVGSALPFSATVQALSGGMVQIKRLGAATAESQLYARLRGFDLAVNDEVICVTYLGVAFVLGKVQRATPSAFSLAGGLIGEVATPGLFRQATSDNAANASTSTWLSTISSTITPPAGTWQVEAVFIGRMTHSASGNLDLRIVIGGSASATFTIAAQSGAPGSLVMHTTQITIVSDGSTPTAVETDFRANAAGTVTPSGSIMVCRPRRLS